MVVGVVQYEYKGSKPWDGAVFNNTFAVITDNVNSPIDKPYVINSIASGMKDYANSGSWFKEGRSHLTSFRLMLIY